MDEQTRGFRSAIFGGFNREDVLHYIEETDTKYYTETAELRSQLTEAQSAMNELRTQNEALTAKNAELPERQRERARPDAHIERRANGPAVENGLPVGEGLGIRLRGVEEVVDVGAVVDAGHSECSS